MVWILDDEAYSSDDLDPTDRDEGVNTWGEGVKSWAVTASAGRSVQVRAGSWLVALGLGLEALGETTGLERLVCEMLPQGKVIARDVQEGRTWIINETHRPRGRGRHFGWGRLAL